MNFANLTKFDDTFYTIIKTTDPKIWVVAELFVYELYSDTKIAKEFLLDSNWLATGDSISLYKDGDNIIIDDTLHDYEEEHEDRVVMHKDEFLKMLNDWQKVYSQKPDEIIITQDDNGKISITGKFTDGREI